MPTRKTETPLTKLYKKDKVAWLDTMVELLRKGKYGELDYFNLRDLLGAYAGMQMIDVETRLIPILIILLKHRYPRRKKMSRSNKGAIRWHQEQLEFALRNRSQRDLAAKELNGVYKRAVYPLVMRPPHVPEKSFPARCPWTIDELMRADITNNPRP